MASRTFRQFVQQELGELPHFIVSAILEWILIILLFVDSFLAHFSIGFAKYFELKAPCVLCTRIDHGLSGQGKKPNSYCTNNESICESHKKDISSLAYCHVHRKLSDIRNMCEGCLLSFATEKESETDANRSSMVGVLQKDVDRFDGGMQSDVHRCSCCGEALKGRHNSNSKGFARSASGILLRSSLGGPVGASPRASMMGPWRNIDEKGLELPHIRYTELKFISDNDSEMPEDEYAGLNADGKQIREEMKSAAMPLLPDPEEINEESIKTPTFGRNRFFGIPLTDTASASGSPRWAANRFPRKLHQFEKPDVAPDGNDMHMEDGDSILHHLRRQVRMDRKSLIALYMELDEERSASAVAANNAMAMITRLQAEKAAVQMEALQYQRMMEEQAEYDQEAIQVLKDLVVKREEEIKVLEADIEAYREKFGEIKKVGSDECEADPDECYQEFDESDHASGETESSSGRLVENGKGSLDEAISLDFENERSHLFDMLKNLENKVHPSEHEDDNENIGQANKAILTREVSLIRERLRAIEAESGFLKHTAMTLQKGGEGTKLLTEIAQHLRKLRHSDKTENETETTTDA